MVARIKAVYTHGVFAPVEPVAGLADNQIVQLQISPAAPEEAAPAEGEDWWERSEAEWAAMSPWERQEVRDPGLTPEEMEERVRWVYDHWGIRHMTEEQALEIAMDDSLLEENSDL